MPLDLIRTTSSRRFFIIMDTALGGRGRHDRGQRAAKRLHGDRRIDMIEWLKKHGCAARVSAITLGMYDACFGYENGDPNLRSMGAGSTLYGGLRFMFTYRGALMWWMNAGMGETIMSPHLPRAEEPRSQVQVLPQGQQP